MPLDLSKLSKEDIQAIGSGNFKQISDEGLQTLMSQQAPKQELAPQQTSQDNLTPLKNLILPKIAAASNFIKGASFGNLDPTQLPGVGGYLKEAETATPLSPVAAKAGELSGAGAGGYALGNAATSLLPEAAGLGSRVLRTIGQSATGALQGYLNKPSEADIKAQGGDESAARGHQAKIAAMVAGPIAGAAELAAPLATGTADYLMKAATGIKKDLSGVDQAWIDPKTGEITQTLKGLGNKLVDMGVRGFTKSDLADQVSSKLASEGQNLQDLTSSLKDVMNPQEVADAVSQHAKRFTLSTGEVSPGEQGNLDYVRNLADEFRNLKTTSPTDFLKIKQNAGLGGFTAAGNVRSGLPAQLDRTVGGTIRTMLGKANPEILETSGNLQALKLANEGLNRPGNVQGNPLTRMLFAPLSSTLGPIGTAGQTYGAAGLQGLGNLLADPALQRAAQQGVSQIRSDINQ